ncbi:MAG: CHAT domain-containing protein [Deltaproteobacteria bacterium]|nr:CHAT domain-containing protein [Deltaproteobacteria bacterium]
MRLSFHVQGEEVVGAIEAGALSFKRSVPYAPVRIKELTNELMVVLGRSGRKNTLSAAHLQRLNEVGGQLHHQLIHPELALRLPASDEAIFLQLDEALVAIPWELLHDGESFWCHRYDLGRAVQTPQAMVAKAACLPSTPLRMLVICADPRDDLPHVMSEGEALIERLDANNTVDANLLVNPTVEQVRRQLTRYDVVHFAGHADHDPVTPEQSGWHLADGKLTATQIAAMGGARTMPFLVFANACNSTQTGEWTPILEGGSSSNLPVYGLANAFLLAGVRLYVGTQQEVVDGQSENLSIAFYQALARGAGAGQAMRVARRDVIRQQGEGAMAWASYVLYGDPSLTPMQPSEFRPKELLNSTLRDIKASLPAKRLLQKGPAAVPYERGMRRARWVLPTVALSVVLTLSALGLSAWLLLRGSTAASTMEGAEVLQFAQHEERMAEAPTVAIAAPQEQKQCLERALMGDARFALVGATSTEVKKLDIAQAYARSVQAELVIFVKEGRVQVADVLTGDIPVSLPLGTGDQGTGDQGCRALFQQMARTFLGEGEVLAVQGDQITVNLGWRSRVAPGMMLTIIRKGRQSGRLQVEKVEMERCTARGKAKKNDQVRMPR